MILDLNFTFKNHTETKSNELRCRFKITEQIKTIYSMKFIIVIQSNLVFFNYDKSFPWQTWVSASVLFEEVLTLFYNRPHGYRIFNYDIFLFVLEKWPI